MKGHTTHVDRQNLRLREAPGDLFDQRQRQLRAVDIEPVLGAIELNPIESVLFYTALDLLFGSLQSKMGICPAKNS